MNSIVGDGALRVIFGGVDQPPSESPERVVRPRWQATPCPPWCQNVHQDGDHTADRLHAAILEPIELSLYDDGRAGDGSEPGEVRVALAQHYRHAEPAVTLMMPAHELEDSSVTGEMDLALTMAEARALHDRLAAALEMAGEEAAR
jgi:hypothetical protein